MDSISQSGVVMRERTERINQFHIRQNSGSIAQLTAPRNTFKGTVETVFHIGPARWVTHQVVVEEEEDVVRFDGQHLLEDGCDLVMDGGAIAVIIRMRSDITEDKLISLPQWNQIINHLPDQCA